MENINSLIRNVKPSATLAIKNRANELKAEGKKIIDLSTGEPDIDTPQFIKDAAIKAMNDGKTKYTAVQGIMELRQAVADKFSKDNGIPTQASDVIITNGGKQALHEVFQVCLEPEDEVIVPAPYWVSYPSEITIAGGVAKIIKTEAKDGYKVTPEQLEKALTPKTKIFVFNSPSNPTGAGYTLEEQQALGKVLAKHNCLIISDEVYEKIVFDGFKFVSFAKACPDLQSRTVTVNAFSKTYSMTGWRVGYVTGPRDIMAAVSRYQSHTTSNVCSIAQYAALAALSGNIDFLDKLIQDYESRLSSAMEIIQDIKHLKVYRKPEGAFYLFVSIEESLKKVRPDLDDSVKFSTYLLEDAGVAVVPGQAFGDDTAFRISVSSSIENIKAGLLKIKDALNKL